MKVHIHQCFNHHVKFPLDALSKAIMGFQKTNYSHYAMSFEHKGSRFFVHASFPVSRQVPEKEFLAIYELKKTYILEIPNGRASFLFWLNGHLGKVYPFMQLVGIALRMLKFVKKNPFGKGQAYLICNELVIMFLNNFFGANIEDTDSVDLNETERILDGLSNIRSIKG
jgi:hypothetical protein